MHLKKKNITKHLAFLGFSFFALLFHVAYAADSIALVFTSQNATALGSNNSVISVDSNLSYINKGNNSSVIGNYFTGHYYDSVLGYFETDWSSNSIENVRVIGSTSACGTGYGYKLGGYAYSPAFGFVDFDYNVDTFVYYCVDDSQLHGFSYNETLGFQNFEGINFVIQVTGDTTPEEPTGTGAFVNDETEILEDIPDPVDPNQGEATNSNFNPNSIQNDIIEFEAKKESLFYIIK